MTPSGPNKGTGEIPIEWYPIGGVNAYDQQRKLSLNEASSAVNFLYQQKMIRTRPGLSLHQMTSIDSANTAFWGKGFINNGNYTNLVIDSASNLWRVDNATSVGVAVTGPALTLGAFQFMNAALVNGVLLVANDLATGMLRWDTTGNIYTVMATAPFRYVTGLLSRAVGAFDPTVAAVAGARTIGWTVAGDETIWTGSTNGSGSAILSDIPDGITGIKTLHNVLVICRSYGFHLGFQTGLAFPAFRFEKWSDKGAGVFYPSSLDADENSIYFVGHDDVYTFDLNRITPIGGNLRNTIIAAITANPNSFQGFLTRVVKNGVPRHVYNLIGPFSAASNVVHYSYDIETGAWSTQSYSLNLVNFTQDCAWNVVDNASSTEFGFGYASHDTVVQLHPNLNWWDDSVACKNDALMSSGQIQIGNAQSDYTLNRLLFSYNTSDQNGNDPGARTVSFTVTCTLAGTQQTTGAISITLNHDNKSEWVRQWVDVGRLVGQNFQISLDQTGNIGDMLWDSVLLIFNPTEATFRG